MTTEVKADNRTDGPTSAWDDPSIPAGNSPPLPGWPLWVSAALWGAWMVFLAVTALTS